MPPPPVYNRGPRQSVCAEAYGDWNKERIFVPTVYPKTEEQKERLKERLAASFLFSGLDAKDLTIVVDAMQEVNFEPGTRIITEGQDGEHLFFIEEGSPECKKLIDGEERVVKTCVPGDVFGELALLYNAPRAATVDATDRCKCWNLDRKTFNHIVKAASTERVDVQDEYLKKVGLFQNMNDTDRAQLAYALKAEKYQKGDCIIQQDDDKGDKFYIVEEGFCVARRIEAGQEDKVLDYGPGDYFGELALLMNQPRKATVSVSSDQAKVLSLDRRSFGKMIGSLQDLLKREYT